MSTTTQQREAHSGVQDEVRHAIPAQRTARPEPPAEPRAGSGAARGGQPIVAERARRGLSRAATLAIRAGLASLAVFLLLLWADLPVAFEHKVNLVLAWIAVAAVTAGLGSAARLIASLRAPTASPSAADPDVRRLIAEHGHHDSLGYFALRDDKSVIFSPSGKAAVCYRVVGGVSLASGDPLGDPEAWPQAIMAWLAEARRSGLRPAVIGAGERAARTYSRHGLRVLELGDEAVVDTGEFSLDGRQMRCVRQAAARVRRAGYEVRIRRVADLSPAEIGEVAARARDWRCGGERGFSMALGRIGGASDPEYLLAEALDSDGTPRALLGFVPWGPDGLSLDLMRRDRDADNGLFEFLITELLARAGGLGVRRVSLNFAMFRSAFARSERIGAGPVLRAWCGILRLASRFWQVEQLYRANAKYRPQWTPRYLCYSGRGQLAKAAFAVAAAEGFVADGQRVSAALARPAISPATSSAGMGLAK
ncbi:MAG: hypothetical protein JWO79_4934 [Actinomycetia bacterium]|nr:hypothetical protein [Actinomycetes bacterium]